MPRKNEIPNKPRFSLATERAYDLLLEFDIGELPVDPRRLAKNFSSIHICGYMELKVNTDADDPCDFDKINALIDQMNQSISDSKRHTPHVEGVTKIIRGTNDYLIVYDDRVNNHQRVRWTIAHELGHVILGHLVDFEETALNRCGLSKTEYGVLEVEANWFAAELLSPRPIMRVYPFEDNDTDALALMCDMSKDAAMRRYGQITKDNFYDQVQDNRKDKLLRNFWNYIESDGALKTIHDSANSFYGSYLYPEMIRHCRVCKRCNACIGDEKQQYCHICGKKMPDCYTYMPYKNFNNGGLFSIGYDIYVKGKSYHNVEEAKDNKVAFCPVCKNHDFSEQAQFCKICGTALYNQCLSENKVISASCRYCPDCGSEAVFNNVYANLPKKINPADYTVDLDDFIEYEYWNFVCMTIGYWEKEFDLYTALSGSRAYRDDGEFVILVTNDKEKSVVDIKTDVVRRCLSNRAYTFGIKNVRCYSRDI